MLSVRVWTIATGDVAQKRLHRLDFFFVVGDAGMREQVQADAQTAPHGERIDASTSSSA